ncbi:MAG: hypothetical protein WBV74_07915 [Pseudonocardiaceae bacterium]
MLFDLDGVIIDTRFVGDTANNMAADRSAGVLAVGAGWGFVGRRVLELAEADVVLIDPSQVGIGLLAHLDGQRVADPVIGWRSARPSA